MPEKVNPLSRPAPARGPAGGALQQRKRPARTSSGGQGRALQRSQPGILRFYADETPGLKIGPTTVLVMSLMFIGFVVLLHIYGKLTAVPDEVEPVATPGAPPP